MRPSFFIAVCFAFIAVSPASARLLWADNLSSSNDRRSVILPSYGSAVAHISVLHPLNGVQGSDVSFSSSRLYDVSLTRVEKGPDYYNYTFDVDFNGDPGVERYAINVHGNKLEGTFVVAGFVIKEDGKVVSGDDGDGVVVGHEGLHAFEVEAIGTDGRPIDLSMHDNMISPMGMNGHTYMEEVDRQATAFTAGGQFLLGIGKFRVGTGAFILTLESPGIQHNGEVFETILHVTQPTFPRPPCVVDGHELVARNGEVSARMYNVLTEENEMKQVTLTIGGQTVHMNEKTSTLSLPTAKVKFTNVPTQGGRARIACDGEPATILSDYNLGQELRSVGIVSGENDVDGKHQDVEEDLQLPSVVRLASTDAQSLTNVESRSSKEMGLWLAAVGVCIMAAALVAAVGVSEWVGKRRAMEREESEESSLSTACRHDDAMYRKGCGRIV